MTKQFRVLVTGSREWPLRSVVEAMLEDIYDKHHVMKLIHGACPRGADYYADEWARFTPDVAVKRYRADWNKYGVNAGLARNKEMVEGGADLCVAFIYSYSRGATHCARLAAEVMPVIVIRWDDEL